MATKDSTHALTSKQDKTSIFKTPKRRNYVTVTNELATDDRLTLEAKGLMLLVLSLPPNWDVRFGWLLARAPRCGRQKLQNILCDLADCGYLTRKVHHDGKGRFASEYQFHETPLEDVTGVEKPTRFSRHGSTDAVNHAANINHSVVTALAEKVTKTQSAHKRALAASSTKGSSSSTAPLFVEEGIEEGIASTGVPASTVAAKKERRDYTNDPHYAFLQEQLLKCVSERDRPFAVNAIKTTVHCLMTSFGDAGGAFVAKRDTFDYLQSYPCSLEQVRAQLGIDAKGVVY